jgi:4-diphosphocytidyl-2-C-methyl-D-erythritol kinase
MTLTERAPAKINLCLFLGPTRASDGRHELVSVMQSLTLADEVTLQPAGAGAADDTVVCPGVDGPNLAGAALAAFREATGWDAPAQRLTIAKRVPVAAGMGGGSGDAAAALRLAARASGLGDDALLHDLAAGLGADVPAQVRPGRALATGAGERVQRLSDSGPFGVLILPGAGELSTAAVYRAADRLGLARDAAELRRRHDDVRRAVGAGPHDPCPPDDDVRRAGGAGPRDPRLPHDDVRRAAGAGPHDAGRSAGPVQRRADGADLPVQMLVNDLQLAALALAPEIEEALDAARAAGADVAMVSGSGPTVLGLFLGPDGPKRARERADALADRRPAPLVAEPEPNWPA